MLLIPNGKIQNFPTVVELGSFSNFIDQPFFVLSIENLAPMGTSSGTIVEERAYTFMRAFWGNDTHNIMFTGFFLYSGNPVLGTVPLVSIVNAMTRVILGKSTPMVLITSKELASSPEFELLRTTLLGQPGFYLFNGERVVDVYAELGGHN